MVNEQPKTTPEKAPQPKLSPERARILAIARESLAWAMPDIKKRQKSPEKKTKSSEKIDPKKLLPEDITKEKIAVAKQYIALAIQALQKKDPYKTALKTAKINIKQALAYLPIAIKESRADNSKISKAGAVGYFQLTNAAIAGIKEAYDITIKPEDLKDPTKNCIAGILYFHYCQDFYPQKWDIKCDKKELMAALMYNAGPTIYRDIYRLLGKQKSYRAIEKFLSTALISQLPDVFTLKKDKQYSQGYRVYHYSDFEIKGDIRGKSVSINGKSYSAVRIVQALHYARTVESIRNAKKYSV